MVGLWLLSGGEGWQNISLNLGGFFQEFFEEVKECCFLLFWVSCDTVTFLVFTPTNTSISNFFWLQKSGAAEVKVHCIGPLSLQEGWVDELVWNPKAVRALAYTNFFYAGLNQNYGVWNVTWKCCFSPQHYNTSLLAAAAAAVSASDDQELLHSRFFPYTSSQMFLDQLNAGGSSSLPATNGSNSGSNSSLVSSNSLRENHGHPVASRSGTDTASIFGIIPDIISLDWFLEQMNSSEEIFVLGFTLC